MVPCAPSKDDNVGYGQCLSEQGGERVLLVREDFERKVGPARPYARQEALGEGEEVGR